jgi:hypothetical protein
MTRNARKQGIMLILSDGTKDANVPPILLAGCQVERHLG